MEREVEWAAQEYSCLLRLAREGFDLALASEYLGRSRVDVGAAADRLLPPLCRPRNARAAYSILRSYAQGSSDVAITSRAKDPAVRKPLLRASTTSVRLPTPIGAFDNFDAFAFRNLDRQNLLILVSALLASVPDARVREMLSMRVGLSGDARTLAAIGLEYSVSRERVRQILSKALGQLRARARYPNTPGSVLRFLIDKTIRLDDRPMRLAQLATDGLGISAAVGVAFLLAASGFDSEDVSAVLRAWARTARDQEETNRRAVADQSAGRLARVRNARVTKWMDDADWPKNRLPAPEQLAPARQVNPLNRTGSFASAKLNRDVHYESELERKVLIDLEKSSIVSSYQEQPFAIPYLDRGRERTYFPDVFVSTVSGDGLLIEVKPIPNMAVMENQLKASAGRQWAHDRGWGWVIVEGNQTFRDAMEHPVPDQAKTQLARSMAERGYLNWREITSLRQRHALTSKDVTACILQLGWDLSLTPFYQIRAPQLSSS